MIVTAVLLLPGIGVLLLVMSRVEDWLAAAPGAARHARGGRRHLRLVRGGAADAPARPAAKPSPRRAHAA